MRMTFGRGFTGLAGLLAVSAGFSLLTMGCKAAPTDDVSESSTAELGARAADPTGVGPLATTSAEYRFAATTDPDILADRKTEIWARVYRPSIMASNEKHPVLVFLHGNHGTCGRGSNPRIDDNTQYTSQGTCPTGYVPTPNHLGYGYIAERLASWGYVVVSVNANRGITAGSGASDDFGLNLARGRLILKHLQLLSTWNNEIGETPASLGVDLVGKLDFSNVGMMGHSRGGEGVRAAYVQYKDLNSPWPARITDAINVKAIFEIGPVDGQTSRVLDANGTAWNVILPMCDGDVFNLQGMRPFDRMLSSTTAESNPTPKGMFAVWGANHNFFNTEWQQSDSSGCRGTGHTPLWDTTSSTIVGSTKQQTAGMHALMGFFRAHVGANANTELNNAYDPLFQVPQTLEDVTLVTRAYADASNAANVKVLEDFTKPAGTALSGQPTASQNVTVTHGGVSEHDPILKAASIKWTTATNSYFEVPFVAPGASIDASAMKTLDFRVSRQNTTPASAGALSFSIRLINKDGTQSQAVKLSSYMNLATWGGHAALDTARIPLADFTNAQLANIKGVRFQFDDTASGAIFLTSIRLSRSALVNTSAPIDPGTNTNLTDTNGTQQDTVAILTGNQVNGMQLGPANGEVEVELESGYQFPVTDDLPRLRIGTHDVLVSGFREHGDTHKIVFKITKDELANLPATAPMKVRYGADHATYEWDFGSFKKSSITTR